MADLGGKVKMGRILRSLDKELFVLNDNDGGRRCSKIPSISQLPMLHGIIPWNDYLLPYRTIRSG